MRAALTEPIFGSTKRRSRTRAVLTHGGGSARICTSLIVPDARFFFSSALAIRISFACSSERSRCSRDLPGTPVPALLSDTLRFSSQNRPLVKRARSGDRLFAHQMRLPRGASKSLIEHSADDRRTCRTQFPAEKSALARRNRIFTHPTRRNGLSLSITRWRGLFAFRPDAGPLVSHGLAKRRACATRLVATRVAVAVWRNRDTLLGLRLSLYYLCPR